MKNFYRTFLLLSFILPLISADISLAQTGKLKGRVIDKSTGEPLPGVNVMIIRQILANGNEVSLSQSLGAASDIEGYYFILNVPSGQYALRASIVGYSPVIIKPVKVDIDRTIEADFELESATIEVEQVVVTAKREIIKQDISSTQEVIVTERLESMPILRMDEFIGTLKGIEVSSTSQGHGLSFRGGAPRESEVFMDGVSLRDPRSEISYLGLNTTSIKEIQVQTGGFESKYGGVRSGVMNVVTKEGQRDKYTFSLRTDYTPENQKRFYGTNPYSSDSWIYRVYADTSENGYAFRGVNGDSTVPSDFENFKGWGKLHGNSAEERALDSLQRWELWKLQHPQYSFARRPDIFVEGTLTGPIPGENIPIFGEFAKRTTFMLGGKYENSQFAFPIGARDGYLDYNMHVKLTSQISRDVRVQASGIYAKIESLAGGFSTYNGALIGETNSFGFFNNTQQSVGRAANLIGSSNWNQIYNKSRLQFYDQKMFAGSAKLIHTLSERAFYSISFNLTYNDQNLEPFSMDTTGGNNYVTMYSERAKRNYSFYVPDYGTPFGSTNYQNDLLGTFALTGGPQKYDSSYSYTYQLKGDLTWQLGKYHQIETGFQAQVNDLLAYSGTYYQSRLSFTPDTWQYYKARPLELGLYIQDKIEFEGMILKLGLRMDYLNTFRKSFEVSHPLDEDYMALYNIIYDRLPGDAMSYERWVLFRELLESPPGWPEKDTESQLVFAPRLGVSFPVTENSKLYFNYGMFYQRPALPFLYGYYIGSGSVSVPTPGLLMGKTTSYEFGYEQIFLDDYLFNITAYYKDVKNDPLSRLFVNFYNDIKVSQYFADAYSDVRGFELRLEKQVGRFFTFNAMYDYMLQSYGATGLKNVFENRRLALDELRSSIQTEFEPTPRANVTVNLHTPMDFGPELGGLYLLGDWNFTYFFTWRDGGRFLSNPLEYEEQKRIYVEYVNRWNADLRVSKGFNTSFGSMEIILIVQNLHDLKWLNTGNMTQKQFNDYKNSLKTPDKGGSDKWGEYDKDYINTGWYEAPVFLNPRRFVLGLRLNL